MNRVSAAKTEPVQQVYEIRPRKGIPVAAPIEGRGSSWLTQYEEMKGAVRMRNYSDKTLDRAPDAQNARAPHRVSY
jgi:hypothetical protein